MSNAPRAWRESTMTSLGTFQKLGSKLDAGLAARPEVLILDEPTSALDPQSEALIGESLLGIRSNVTLFIVAHRMSTLEMCDRVMVILDGRLAGFDTKEALQRENSYYRHASQLAAGGALL